MTISPEEMMVAFLMSLGITFLIILVIGSMFSID
jgi:hypothetical protein